MIVLINLFLMFGVLYLSFVWRLVTERKKIKWLQKKMVTYLCVKISSVSEMGDIDQKI